MSSASKISSPVFYNPVLWALMFYLKYYMIIEIVKKCGLLCIILIFTARLYQIH